ncbi:hypothetical protein SAMN05443579_10795 [Variovorax sp. PDC80]|nr:hypothetical protein SAMN05443579_10795 [Variovorax sp. PDC80]
MALEECAPAPGQGPRDFIQSRGTSHAQDHRQDREPGHAPRLLRHLRRGRRCELQPALGHRAGTGGRQSRGRCASGSGLSAEAARAHGRHGRTPVPRPRARGRAGRPAPPCEGHALARPRNRERPVAGREARETAAAGAVLGQRLRLAQGRGAAQCPAAVHHRDRRPRHPLHPREVAPSRCAAAGHDPWLARLGDGTAQDHRPARQPHRPRRPRRGCLPPRAALDARLRLLGQAAQHRLGPRPHRPRLGRADEAAGLPALRVAGRRLGLGHLGQHGAPEAAGPARHPRQHAGQRAAAGGAGAQQRRPRARRPRRQGEGGLRCAELPLQKRAAAMPR